MTYMHKLSYYNKESVYIRKCVLFSPIIRLNSDFTAPYFIHGTLINTALVIFLIQNM